MSQNPSSPKIDAYAVFIGPINQETAQRITANLVSATTAEKNIGRVHLLFQSTGGFIGEGVFLYHLLRTLPVDLTIYNSGSVQSIAVIAYLGAQKRKATASATFVIHRTIAGQQPATARRLRAIAESVLIDDRRTEAILRTHVRLTDEQWDALDHHDLTFSGEDAVALGFADELGDFSPPPGT